jgi:hypothetical protein
MWRTCFNFIKKLPLLGKLLHTYRKLILYLIPHNFVLWFYCPLIDWNKIDTEINNYLISNAYGITEKKRNPKFIISLTSYPARIPRIHYTIISLLKQTVKSDEIILWLGKEQFPNKNDDLSKELIKLTEHGLTIKYCKDIRSYKKLIPALLEYPEDIIITVDDDIFYENNFLEILVNSYEQNQTVIHCHRVHKITFAKNGNICGYNDWKWAIDYKESEPSYINFITGVGGVLYPPHVLYSDIANESLFMKLSPTADDIWFWAMSVLNETKICVVKNNISKIIPNYPLTYKEIVEPSGLGTINIGQNYNDIQLKQVLEHYPLISQRLGLTE